MNSSTLSRYAFGMFVALPLLPLCGFVLHAAPEVVFYMGAASFFLGVLLLVWLLAARSLPPAGSAPVARPFRFTIRGLLCLTTVLFGMLVFMVSGFKCEAAERASRPGPLPAGAFRQFVWEMETGLVSMALGSLVWLRPPSGSSRQTMVRG
jgi:hypothetical protein